MNRVAKALVQDRVGNILVLRRSHTHPLYAHHLDFPGGEIEPNEDIIEGVIREIEEETRLRVKASTLSLAFERQADDNSLHHLYIATLQNTAPKVTISWEHNEHRWMTVAELLQTPIPPNADRYYLAVIEWLHRAPANSAPSSLLQ